MKSIRVKNLRSILDSGEIDINRLNLFLGENSSGKSSILRLFPLLKEGGLCSGMETHMILVVFRKAYLVKRILHSLQWSLHGMHYLRKNSPGVQLANIIIEKNWAFYNPIPIN